MAKREVSQKDISAGLDNIGAVDGLFGKSKSARRDSPFRSTKAEESEPIEPAPSKVQPEPAPQPEVVIPREISTQQLPQRTAEKEVSLQSTAAPASRIKEDYSRAEASQGRVSKKRLTSTKAEEYDERVTLPMSSEMRDACEALAKQLQKRRTEKSERITSNTVMRCFLEACLEGFQLEADDYANNEEELYELIVSKVRR